MVMRVAVRSPNNVPIAFEYQEDVNLVEAGEREGAPGPGVRSRVT
jgi:hypothetical protein